MSSKASARAQKAAEMRAAQKKRESRRRLLTIGGVALAMILIVGGAIAVSLWQQDKDQEKLEQAVSAESDYGVAIGPKDAPHDVVIYEDFLCPFCGSFERASEE